MSDEAGTLALPSDVPQPSGLDFAVVGLGASAGGLAALIGFFENLPAAPDMAFVVILHLSPEHESSAAEILQRSCVLPVVQVRQAMAIERDHVYVIPPRHGLSMNDGHLGLTDAEKPRGRHVAIDLFFRTLADAHRARAFAAVLSGSGADGSVGIARIKEQGGVVLAQAPSDAEHAGMPESAIATGKVDIVLPAAAMPTKLLELWRNARSITLPPAGDAPSDAQAADVPSSADDAMRAIMTLLHKATGHDFKHYKRATVLRRVERRLQVNGMPNLAAYLEFLRREPAEAQALLGDMLIGVTQFFRDRGAFEAVQREVLPALFEAPLAEEQLRVWVPGCSTGEEAYSFALMLTDAATHARHRRDIQIFASDIDESALASARQARYPAAILADVPQAHIGASFTQDGDGFRIAEPVRKKVLFALHNVLRDPPFSHLDMVSCRNLLIYLDRDVQADMLQMFHFALRPGGYLFLGSSETADAAAKLFSPVDKKHGIYQANATVRSTRALPHFPLGSAPNRPRPVPGPRSDASDKPVLLSDLHERLLLAEYTPASVIVNQDSEIVHSSAGAARFLHFGEGEPSHKLLSIVHADLRPELRSSLFEALQTRQPVTARPVAWTQGGDAGLVHMAVEPLQRPEWPENMTLVVFRLESRPRADPASEAADGSLRTQQLESELRKKDEQLHNTIARYESSAENLKASNEELQAINEELRSMTEELETSKEELQSVNEELVTVNFELKLKVDETSQINDDLQNLVSSTEIATVFVDAEMRIKRFTAAAASIFNIIDADIGRSLLDITHRLDYKDLAADAAATFGSLRMVEREVRSDDGRWFLARLLPYRTVENRINGAVLTFIDISSRLLAETGMQLGEERMRLVAECMPEFAILTLDTQGRFTSWSKGAERLLGYTEAEVLGEPVELIFTADDREAGVPAAEMRGARETGRALDERWHLRKDGTRLFLSGVMTPLKVGNLQGYAKIARDVTQSFQEAGAGEAARVDAEATSRLKDRFLAVMSHELKQPLNLINVNAQLLLTLKEARSLAAVRKAGETIQRSVAAQTRIIDDLLDLSRSQSGKLQLRTAPLDLVEAIRPSINWAASKAAEKGIAFVERGFDQQMTVRGDGVRIEQVVWNLLSNAIKFTPGHGHIETRLFRVGVEAVFEVSDDGRGIAPAFLPHVFDMFMQEDGSTTRSEGGLGIGLGLVEELVALHGGRVEAESAGVGRGATFRIRLPLHEPAGPDPLALPREAPVSLGGLRILLVDDTADMLEVFAQLLRLEGASVTCALGAAAAIEACDASVFDLIVSDIGMPAMDGNELIARLRRRPAMQAVKAIALSGYGGQNDVTQALAAGFDAHLVKPVQMDQFRSLVAGLK